MESNDESQSRILNSKAPSADFPLDVSEIPSTTENYNVNNASIILPYTLCLLLELPKNGSVCSDTPNYSTYSCVECKERSNYLFGHLGYGVSLAIWLATIIVGVVGTLANIFIMVVITRHKSPKAFDNLLFVLAFFDLICCILAAMSSTGIIAFWAGEVARGPGMLWFVYISFFTALLGRTGSTFMTVAISIERYIFVKFPDKCNTWLTGTKGRLVAAVVVLLTILLNVPRYSSFTIEPKHNNFTDIMFLKHLTHIIKSTEMEKTWYGKLHQMHYHIDFWTPFPLTIIFLILLKYEVRQITRARKAQQVTRQKDIREVQIFVPVIIIFLLTNIFPIIHHAVVNLQNVLHRELAVVNLLCIAVKSAVNLPIYYTRSYKFRKETQALVFRFTKKT